METPEWTIDYDAIIAAHLAKQPSRVWPGLRFAIPMSEDEWWGFPRIPGWKYEWDIRLGADVTIRPFGPHYQIPVERSAASAPCEVGSLKWKDVAALKAVFAEAFKGYTDYLYCRRTSRPGGGLPSSAHASDLNSPSKNVSLDSGLGTKGQATCT